MMDDLQIVLSYVGGPLDGAEDFCVIQEALLGSRVQDRRATGTQRVAIYASDVAYQGQSRVVLRFAGYAETCSTS